MSGVWGLQCFLRDSPDPWSGASCSILMHAKVNARKMKRTFLWLSPSFCFLLCTSALGQSGPAAIPSNGGQNGQPVSYASVSQLTGLLDQLDQASKKTQADLVKLRIEHWKTDG